MFYLLILLAKVVYTAWWCVRVCIQFLWKFSIKDIDFTCNSPDVELDESAGYYCKNIIDFWLNKISQSEEVRMKWERERSDFES